MNKLRELRISKGLSQKDIADHFNTTPQTVGRWEKDEIPAPKLPQLAALLGCSTDKLLGVTHQPRQSQAVKPRKAKTAEPFGTLRVFLKSGVIEYPIDEEERDRLQQQHFLWIVESADWLEFETLNNKLVFLNPSYINAIELISDHTEAMPFFASKEAYQALVDEVREAELPAPLREEVAKVIKRTTNERDPQKTRDAAIEELTELKVIHGDGSRTRSYFSDTSATAVVILEDHLDRIASNAFLTIGAEGPDLRVINLSSVAAVEVPFLRYRECIDREMAELAAEQPQGS